MTIAAKVGMYLLFYFALSHTGNRCTAQSSTPDAHDWAVKLSISQNKGNEYEAKLDSLLNNLDSARVFLFLDQLHKEGKSRGDHFDARFNCLEAKQLLTTNASYRIHQPKIPSGVGEVEDPISKLFSSAMDIAYRTNDDYLVAFVSYAYAMTTSQLGQIGVAVIYAKNAVDLYDQLSYPIPASQYQFLAEMLYRVRQYEDCIKYGKKAVAAWQQSPGGDSRRQAINCVNTVALGYHRQRNYDSALLYYRQALQMAKDERSPVWMGIVSGNMAQVYYTRQEYKTAYRLFVDDYKTSRDSGLYNNAGNSLQWAARSSLALGDKSTALTQVREAMQLLKLAPGADYLKNTYYSATLIFMEMRRYDSAFYYDKLFSALNDSIEKVVAANSLAITRTRLNDMSSRYNVQKLNKEKSAVMARNMVIVCIVILFFFALLLLNRKILKTKLEKEKAEQEISSTRNLLDMSTQNMVEKINLIEKLEQQLKGREVTVQHSSVVSELSRQTILTEEDWNKFRSLFETIYPGFFTALREKFPDSTVAENRLAALTRLNLTTKQIASMLGISVDSVHKSRQRLRQRFQVNGETNLEEVVSAL
jgi:tetratricopeptide (TPR) repeat protein/DNA-binding CsgD family transcriptional regulator